MKQHQATLLLLALLLLYSTQADAQWVQTNGPPGYITSLAVSGRNLFAAAYRIYRSTDNGTSWTAADSGLTDPWVLAIAVSGTNLFAGTSHSGVFRSSDDGASWTPVNQGLPTYRHLDTDYVRGVFCIAVNGTNILAGTVYSGVYLSRDNGSSWTPAGLPNYFILDLAASGSDLFAATMTVDGPTGVYLSTDSGTTWSAVNSGLTNLYVEKLATSGKNLFAGTSAYYGPVGLFVSTNNGRSWTFVDSTSGLPSWGVTAIAVSDTNLFVANADTGVYLSSNSGSSWTAVNSGLTYSSILAFAVGDTNLFGGTDNDHVWKRPLAAMLTTSVQPLRGEPPQAFSLHQNYPNPFNPSTAIRYGLPNRSRVSLTVFNTLGQQVALLQNGEQEAGYHEVKFDGTNLSSGVYFYRIQAGMYVETKKLILAK